MLPDCVSSVWQKGLETSTELALYWSRVLTIENQGAELFSDYMCVCVFPTSKTLMEAVHAIVRNAGIGTKVISKIAFLQEKHKNYQRIKEDKIKRLCWIWGWIFSFLSQIIHTDLVLPIKGLPEEIRIRSYLVWVLLKGEEKTSLKIIPTDPILCASKPHPQGAFNEY